VENVAVALHVAESSVVFVMTVHWTSQLSIT